jgi:hypothetical protein
MKEVFIRNEGRREGNYSIYVTTGSNGSWYTGLTYGSARAALSMVSKIRKDFNVKEAA